MAMISFSRHFIFVKTRKTAGSSLEVHLERVCGSTDIVTPIYPPDFAHKPRNYDPNFFNHMPATLLRALQPDAFALFLKFCFERHPVDNCLSHYAMLKNSKWHARPDNPQSWEAYLERGEFPIDLFRYCDDDGKVLVDKIYRYEDMDAALLDISERLECDIGPLTVREKSGFRSEIPTFAAVMNEPRQKERIMTAFAASLRVTPYD
jgi:hypothetical protein